MTTVGVPGGGSIGAADGGLIPVLRSAKGDGRIAVVGAMSVE